MPRVLSLIQTEQPIRPLSGAARRLAVMGRACAKCGSTEIRPSNRRNALDILVACLFLAPFRCRACRERFYRVWRPSLMHPPDPPRAPVLVMNVRHRLVDLDVNEMVPCEAPLVGPQAQPPLTAPTQPAAACAILILESDLSIRRLLSRLLERRGHCIFEISQARDLAAELRDRHTDLLIVDLPEAGDMSVDVLVALAHAHPSLKILALSARSLQNHEIPGRLLALPRPFPLDSFVDSVDRLLERPMRASAP
jgi:CheY-like chemotaxis protein